eukprot:6692389-Prymnesium_polylepis.1
MRVVACVARGREGGGARTWHEDNEEGQQPEGDLQHGVGVDEAVDEDERDEDNEVCAGRGDEQMRSR